MDRIVTSNVQRLLLSFAFYVMVWLLLPTTAVFAQSVNGLITGTVTDSSGAVVPGAQISVANQATGLIRTTGTNGSGTYILPELPPGLYKLSATKTGFASVSRENIELQVNQSITLSFQLAVGSESHTIDVIGAPPQLNTTSATLSDVVGQAEMVGLPLNGREFTQLTLLTPGAVPEEDSQQSTFTVALGAGGISPSVNGQRGEQNNFTMDGVLNNATFTNTWVIAPPPDAIQEFNVQSHITDAQFAISSGANINVVTRSGTNNFHGAVWEFFRNDVLDAKTFPSTQRLPYRQNQYGVYFAGPVTVPHIYGGKDKTWFSFYWEGFRSSLSTTILSSTLTPAMMRGDFSGVLGAQVGVDSLGRPEYANEIYNPFTSRPDPGHPGSFLRDPFPGNMIPTQLLNPASLLVLQKYYPAPNLNIPEGVLPNYQFSGATSTDSDVFGLRIDHQITQNDIIFARFNRSNQNRVSPQDFPSYSHTLSNYGQQMALGYTHIFVPTTILNFHYGYSYVNFASDDEPAGAAFAESIDFTQAAPAHDGIQLGPQISLSKPDRQMLARVDALPPHTVVMFQVLPQFGDQPDFGTWDLLSETAKRVPTYSAWIRLCIDGCIGGAYYDYVQDWRSTADMAARVLSGARPEDIPILYNTELHATVDWRALRRWHIPESALPPGSVILNREPTLWERGRKYFLLGILVMVLQTLLIFGLLWQRARRRKTETELRSSEEKFSRSFRHSPLAITITTTNDGRYIDVNDSFEAQTGWRRDEVIGRTALDIDLWVDPDQRSSFLKELREKRNVKDLEVALRRRDGQIRTSRGSAELIEVHGEPFALSVFADITEHKIAEQVLANLSGRLIEAQEEERKRIARELHDDISQKLALLSAEVEQANHSLNGTPDATKKRLEEVQQHCSEIAHDVQSLSHRLHSTKLEYLGLVAALRGFCREFGKQYEANIEFTDEDVPRQLPNKIALCLFRVAQEALHNAVKYSGVRQFTVKLTGSPEDLQVVVKDAGAGFDVDEANKNQGLGLLSMQERVHQVLGWFHVQSKPGEGTTIIASVPLPTENGGASAEVRSTDIASMPGAR